MSENIEAVLRVYGSGRRRGGTGIADLCPLPDCVSANPQLGELEMSCPFTISCVPACTSVFKVYQTMMLSDNGVDVIYRWWKTSYNHYCCISYALTRISMDNAHLDPRI